MSRPTKDHDGRGGSRPGAGRKLKYCVARKAVAISLTPDALSALDKMCAESDQSRSDVVEAMIRQKATI